LYFPEELEAHLLDVVHTVLSKNRTSMLLWQVVEKNALYAALVHGTVHVEVPQSHCEMAKAKKNVEVC